MGGLPIVSVTIRVQKAQQKSCWLNSLHESYSKVGCQARLENGIGFWVDAKQ